MNIIIPCSTCGCQHCEAKTKSGKQVKIQICKCEDGSGQFDITITDSNGNQKYESHRCEAKELDVCLSDRFEIDSQTMKHECFED